jgi:hypothetical protein
MHLKNRGAFDPNPSFAHLLASILRRGTRLFSSSGVSSFPENSGFINSSSIKTILSQAEDLGRGRQKFRRLRLHRYSTRRKKKHFIPAVQGIWELPKGAQRFLPILQLGERIGVGKGSTFGMGEFRIVRPQSEKKSGPPTPSKQEAAEIFETVPETIHGIKLTFIKSINATNKNRRKG